MAEHQRRASDFVEAAREAIDRAARLPPSLAAEFYAAAAQELEAAARDHLALARRLAGEDALHDELEAAGDLHEAARAWRRAAAARAAAGEDPSLEEAEAERVGEESDERCARALNLSPAPPRRGA